MMATKEATAKGSTADARSYSTFEWQITATQLEATRAKIAKINARAAKKELGGRLDITATPVACVKVDPHTGIRAEWTEYKVQIGGTAPAYDGWQFIATLDWDEHAGLVVRSVPGAPAVERDRLQDGWCDHCQTVRNRRVTYVVRSMETGEQLQVGRSCVKDFTGWAGTVAFLSAPSMGDEGDWFGPVGRVDYSTRTVLAYAWAVITTHGFVPTSYRGGNATPTRDLVEIALYPSPKSPSDVAFARSLAPVATEAAAKVEKIIDFVTSDDFNGFSEYVLNLKACIAAEQVSPRNFGLVVSAPQAYARHQEQTLIRDSKAKVGTDSQWVGRVAGPGQKMERRDFEVTVAGVRWIDGWNGGSTAVYTLVDPDGNVFKWFAANDTLGQDEGVRFVIKGSVKAHKEWQGTKETHLTRCAVVREL